MQNYVKFFLLLSVLINLIELMLCFGSNFFSVLPKITLNDGGQQSEKRGKGQSSNNTNEENSFSLLFTPLHNATENATSIVSIYQQLCVLRANEYLWIGACIRMHLKRQKVKSEAKHSPIILVQFSKVLLNEWTFATYNNAIHFFKRKEGVPNTCNFLCIYTMIVNVIFFEGKKNRKNARRTQYNYWLVHIWSEFNRCSHL